MIRKCIECEKEYEAIHTGGQEQKYCSKSCRVKSANKRRESILVEKLKREVQQDATPRDETTKVERKYEAIHGQNFGLDSNKIFELVTTNANLTAENKRLQDKVQALEIERGELLAEIDSYEEDEESNSSDMGSIGEIMKPYLPVIVPAIVSIFSPKEKTQQPTNNNGKTTTPTGQKTFV